MLSQSNIDKLHMDGIYRCDPVLRWLPSYKRDNPHWCKNWTFRIKKYKDTYYMHDTYWSVDENPVELTDENIDKFEFLFDLGDVRYVTWDIFVDYPDEDKWIVGLDSGGYSMAKYVVRRDAKKIKEKVVERLEYEINSLKSKLEWKERTLQRVLDDDVDLEYV